MEKMEENKMVVSEDFLKKLKSAFDLNIYEVKIWTAMLSRGVAPAAELSDISGVPRSRSYDVLETLEKKGFVIMKLGKPIKYIAVKPEEILKRMQRRVEEKAQQQLSMLQNIKDKPLYQEIELLHKQGIEKISPTDLAGAIKGRKNINDQLKSMIEKAKNTITIVTTAKGIIRKASQLKTVLKKAAGKGVKIRIAAPISDAQKIPPEFKDFSEIRTMPKKGARFTIVDNKHVMFMIGDDEEIHEAYDLGIWVETPFFASALAQMFDLNWQNLQRV